MKKTTNMPVMGPGARSYRVHVDGECFEVTVEAVGGAPLPTVAASVPQPAAAVVAPEVPVAPQATAAPKAVHAAKGALLAPMPGMVVDYLVKPGDAVKIGDVVVLLEAMKMENGLEAPADGVVAEVCFQKGDSVPKDAVLLTIG